MNLEDVKKIAIEEYGIAEKDLVIYQKGGEVHFSSKNKMNSYIAILRSGLILPCPRELPLSRHRFPPVFFCAVFLTG